MNSRIAVIGTGRMGSSLIRELINMNSEFNKIIIPYDCNKEKLVDLKKYNIELSENIDYVINSSKFLILAVRPQQMKLLVDDIKNRINSQHIIISIAIGVPLKWLSNSLKKTKNIFHVHPPSTIMAFSKGISFASTLPNIKTNIKIEVEKIFVNLGELIWVDESEIEKLAIIAGCSPAFISYFLEKWREMSLEIGLKDEIVDLIISKMFSAIQYGVSEKKLSYSEIINNISTPNGVTLEGLRNLEPLKSLFTKVYESSSNKIESIKKIYS